MSHWCSSPPQNISSCGDGPLAGHLEGGFVLVAAFAVFIVVLIAGAAIAQYHLDRRVVKTGDFLLEARK